MIVLKVYSGEIVGVYDESVFMWTPTEYTTISVFTCWDASVPFSQFTTRPGDTAAIFSLSNRPAQSPVQREDFHIRDTDRDSHIKTL